MIFDKVSVLAQVKSLAMPVQRLLETGTVPWRVMTPSWISRVSYRNCCGIRCQSHSGHEYQVLLYCTRHTTMNCYLSVSSSQSQRISLPQTATPKRPGFPCLTRLHILGKECIPSVCLTCKQRRLVTVMLTWSRGPQSWNKQLRLL